MLARKGEVRGVVDFGPGQSGGASESHVYSVVGQSLDSDIAKLIDPALGNKSIQRAEEIPLCSLGDSHDTEVTSAELQGGKFSCSFPQSGRCEW